MSSIARPPDPCLVAVVLIVRSRSGPKFVFHYPPTSDTSSPRRGSRSTKPSESAGSSEEDAASSSEDEYIARRVGGASASATPGGGSGEIRSGLNYRTSPSPLLSATSAASPYAQRKRSGASAGGGGHNSGSDIETSAVNTPLPEGSASTSRERRADSLRGAGKQNQPPWDTFLGLSTDVWEKLLCPAPAWHKRRFEVGVNDLSFVGWPVFAKENGTWRKKKRKKEKEAAKAQKEPDGEPGEKRPEDSDRQGEDVSARISELGNLFEEAKKPARDHDTANGDSKDEMTMFNVVFVLNPPILEYHIRVKEKYDNVIKKFGKGLKAEQVRADYVWTEAQKISHIKERARESGLSPSALYAELLSKSSLAQAISTIYTSISNSRIASVTLTPETTMSLQIPPLTSTSSLPSITEPAYPGLWLTTAASLSATDEVSGMDTSPQNKVLAKHFALLLLTDEATILKDIEASMGSLGPPLAHYIRSSKPNKSFAQISAQSQIPLSDIQVLANHLVYWRRARAIPPLNQRDTYIVSPNADLSKLGPATAAYEAAFPTLPSLPKMLSALSGTPRPYSSFIPSKDHKPLYFEILAWLMRGGWVTQLRTFGWLKADPEIKAAVAEAMGREEEEKKPEEERRKEYGDTSYNGHAHRDSLNGGEGSDYRRPPSSSSMDSEASGEITPIPGAYGQHTDPYQRGRSRQRWRRRSSYPTTSSLILHPHRASPLESRWLDELLARFPDTHSHHGSFEQTTEDGETGSHDASIQKYWPQFVKYFNGTDALEKIAVREGLKRKVVWRILSRIDMNSLAVQRAHGEVNPREKVLLTVRHW